MISEKRLTNILSIIVATVAVAALAQLSISLPETVSVAPITGQSLAVLVAAHILQWKNASIAMVFYVLLAILGLPVLSDFSGGAEMVFGKSAGYLIGFILAAYAVGRMADNKNQRITHYLLQMTIGTLIILLCGGIGLLRFLDIGDAFALGIKPFIPGGFVKIVIGAILLSIYRRFSLLMNF